MFDLSKINIKIKEAVETFSQKYNIPKKFLYALILTESNFNEYAIRYEPHYRWIVLNKDIGTKLGMSYATFLEVQRFSYGLTQVMGSIFYEHNLYTYPAEFYDVYLNVEHCCIHLSNSINRKKLNPEKQARELYDIYNSGCIDSNDQNEKNVDRFMKNYELF